MYDVKSNKAEEFINDQEIKESINIGETNKSNEKLITSIIKKGSEGKGLSHREAALLLACDIEKLNKRIFSLAQEIKMRIYGKRIVLFAPLYISNYCVNGCVYCPYHKGNKETKRKKLTMDEIRLETAALQDIGHKRIALECGEDPVNNPIEYILESIRTIYSVKNKNGSIRRINVNIAATSQENYKKLKEANIGTYILFQETYNKKNYEKLHPTGPKHNYEYHTLAMDRAMEGGIDDVGLGALFGLSNYKYELTALLMHAEHLEAAKGVGPHTVSVPRIKPAVGIDREQFTEGISDEIFLKIIAVLRIALPYTGIIVSTRESKEARRKALEIGVSQISGGSKTTVGGYGEPEDEKSAQFTTTDRRKLDEVTQWLISLGYIPSFCTACYREGRTGDRFMKLAKSGNISNCCQPNALITLQEYLEDYAATETKISGETLIKQELANINDTNIRNKAKAFIKSVKNGERDFRF